MGILDDFEPANPEKRSDPECKVCGVPLSYSGTGRPPLYCDEHKGGKASASRAQGVSKSAPNIESALNNLGTAYSGIATALVMAGYPTAASHIAENLDATQERNRQALEADPSLAVMVNKFASKSGKGMFVAAQLSMLGPVIPIALAERAHKRSMAEMEREMAEAQGTPQPQPRPQPQAAPRPAPAPQPQATAYAAPQAPPAAANGQAKPSPIMDEVRNLRGQSRMSSQTSMRPGVAAYPRQSFPAHLRGLEWDQGDHLLIAAPTKAGKTTLMSYLTAKRGHVVVMVTKITDDTFRQQFKNFEIYRTWPADGPHRSHKRILLWPKAGKTMAATKANQRGIFEDFLDREIRKGGRCIVADEALYMADPKILNMGNQLAMCHYWGRSSGTSMVTLTQRPSWIPRAIYGNVTHAYVARTRDRQDQLRLSEMGGIDRFEVGANLDRLPARQDYVYLNPQGDAPAVIVNTRK